MIRMSVDDACASDVRVAELAIKYEIPTTFYWPVESNCLALDNGYEALDYAQALAIAKQHEIGSHTITHRHLTKIPLIEAQKEIMGSKLMLERLFHREVTKFCPPRGYTTPELTNFTLGFYDSQRLTKGKGLVHVHPNSGANDNIPWVEYYESMKDTTEDIEIWGHSHEFDKYDLWQELEGFLRYVTRGK